MSIFDAGGLRVREGKAEGTSLRFDRGAHSRSHRRIVFAVPRSPIAKGRDITRVLRSLSLTFLSLPNLHGLALDGTGK